jgi:tetratricopeptide (TPR) repeat protein
MTQPILPDFDSLWDYSDPAGTETQFRSILPQYPEGNERLELLTQIARTQGLQRKFDDAHRTLDEVEKQLTIEPSRATVRYLLERGRVFNSSMHPDQARPFFERAAALAKELKEDSHAVDAVHMLAIVADPGSASLELNLQAIEMAESSADEKARGWLGSLYNNTGWSYHGMGDYESALKIFEKAESHFRGAGSEDRLRIAKWTVARCLRSMNRIEEALSKQMALKAEFDSIGGSDGYVDEEIGECLLLLKRGDEAKPYFAKAYELLSRDEWLTENEPERLKRMKELS